MESPEAVRAFRALDGVAGAGGAGGGASSQFALHSRMVWSCKDRQSELHPEANVAKVRRSGASSKAGGNLERPSPVILARLDMGGDSGF